VNTNRQTTNSNNKIIISGFSTQTDEQIHQRINSPCLAAAGAGGGPWTLLSLPWVNQHLHWYLHLLE